MNKQDKIWLWITAVVSILMGVVLVINDSDAGWFLIILGLTYIATSMRAGQKWTSSNLNLAHWGLIGVTVLAFLLVVVAAAVVLL
jgi:hypothetical protein